MRRAGGCDENAALPQKPDRIRIQLSVGLNRTPPFRFALREGRRIDNHEIKRRCRSVLDPLKRIGLFHPVLTSRNPEILFVQSKISRRRFQRVLTDIHIGDRLRSASRRVERESAGEAESIQDIRPLREFADPLPILTLIEKETGLLPFHRIRLEADPVFEKDDDPIEWRAVQDRAIAGTTLLRDP